MVKPGSPPSFLSFLVNIFSTYCTHRNINEYIFFWFFQAMYLSCWGRVNVSI
jgi:hypothetical protein